ncbi:MAG: DUF3347 domain-containing protein [Oligoflexia bacterium]|nr:DUF3347 domain-containing protein [Oligoflexia bacterium]
MRTRPSPRPVFSSVLMAMVCVIGLSACGSQSGSNPKDAVVVGSGGGLEKIAGLEGQALAAPPATQDDPFARFAFSCCKTPGATAVVSGAVDLAERLAADDQPGTDAALTALQQAAQAATQASDLSENSKALATGVGNAAGALAGKPLADVREGLPTISLGVAAFARENMGGDKKVVSAFCPMKSAHWMQRKGDIQNPFFGQKMPSCGTLEDVADAK